jgi:threonine synthase
VPAGGFSSPVGLCRCCPAPGKPVVVEYDLAAVRAASPAGLGAGPGLFRFEALLPVQSPPEGYADDVGGACVTRAAALSDEHGAEVFIKGEGQNPSGSFKDRGLAVGVALGVASGARRFCLPTQGNAGVAAALFSARLGLPGCLVYMPEGYEGGVYDRACRFFGAEVRFSGKNIAAAGRAMREALREPLSRGEYVDISTFFEPGRLEGKKTMGLEIAERFAAEPLPDFVLYPTGGGTGLVGIWKAFRELSALGRYGLGARPLPKMIAVQSERCAPVVESFRAGLDEVRPVESLGTIADGLDVPGAIMGHGILAVLRESGGSAVAVSEAEIRRAFARYGALGIPAGYESAATLAALRLLRGRGEIPAGARVLLLNTGSHLIPLGKAGNGQ